jgi:hypothetical protein
MTLGRGIDSAFDRGRSSGDEKDFLLLDPLCMVLTNRIKELTHVMFESRGLCRGAVLWNESRVKGWVRRCAGCEGCERCEEVWRMWRKTGKKGK